MFHHMDAILHTQYKVTTIHRIDSCVVQGCWKLQQVSHSSTQVCPRQHTVSTRGNLCTTLCKEEFLQVPLQHAKETLKIGHSSYFTQRGILVRQLHRPVPCQFHKWRFSFDHIEEIFESATTLIVAAVFEGVSPQIFQWRKCFHIARYFSPWSLLSPLM